MGVSFSSKEQMHGAEIPAKAKQHVAWVLCPISRWDHEEWKCFVKPQSKRGLIKRSPCIPFGIYCLSRWSSGSAVARRRSLRVHVTGFDFRFDSWAVEEKYAIGDKGNWGPSHKRTRLENSEPCPWSSELSKLRRKCILFSTVLTLEVLRQLLYIGTIDNSKVEWWAGTADCFLSFSTAATNNK